MLNYGFCYANNSYDSYLFGLKFSGIDTTKKFKALIDQIVDLDPRNLQYASDRVKAYQKPV